MNLLQRPIPRLRHKENGKNHKQSVRPEPDVPVLGAPVELGGVDEVGRGEGAEPVADEVQGGGEP
ncbi:hypothetical protein EG329_013813, partial [Mollisiaceae sp. DMI_Dod_QoI]